MKYLLKELWLLILLILIFLVIALWIILTDHLLLNSIVSLLALIVFIAVAYPSRDRLYAFFIRGEATKWSAHLISLLLYFLIFSSLSFMLLKKPMVWDVTKQKVNTLSDKTYKVLALFSAPIRVQIFARTEERQVYLDLLQLYRQHYPKIEVEFIDLARNPLAAKAHGIDKSGDILLYYKNKKIKSRADNELSLTNGLLKLANEREFNIYISQGHGEVSFTKEGNDSIQFLANELSQNNYLVHSIDLFKQKIPPNADLLIILGPSQPFLTSEINSIRDYLNVGGNLFIALDPHFGQRDPQSELRLMLKQYGVMIPNNVIVDKLSTLDGVDPSILIIKNFNQEHPVTKNMQGRFISPLTSSIQFNVDENKEFLTTALLSSSSFPASWADNDLVGLSQGKADFDKSDIKGPLTVVALLEKSLAYRILAAGSSRAFIDGYKNHPANLQLAINAISYMIDDRPLISLNRPGTVQERVFISEIQMKAILYFCLIFFPLFLLIAAGYFYRRRVRG